MMLKDDFTRMKERNIRGTAFGQNSYELEE